MFIITRKNIETTSPVWLEFKWFFNMFTRRMPWRNCYAPFFENVPFQIGFQEMKDEKSRDFMNQYMVPNARDFGINGIYRAVVKGQYTVRDFDVIRKIFGQQADMEHDSIQVKLNGEQSVEFVKDETYQIELYTNSNTGKFVEIENIKVYC